MPGNPRVFEGHVPGRPDKKVYVQVEALAGLLLEAKEKHINPVSGFYLIPSNAPDRPAGHKVKYTEALTRLRTDATYLGMNAGLIVLRGDAVVETHGSLVLPKDRILGAWAEAYFSGQARPIRHEIGKDEFWGNGPNWDKKGPWMLCKCAMDQLARHKLGGLYLPNAEESEGSQEEGAPPDRGGRLILEAQPVEDAPHPQEGNKPPDGGGRQGHQEKAEQPQIQRVDFVAGEDYTGTIMEVVARKGQTPGSITLSTDRGPLTAYFWSYPDALKGVGDGNESAAINLPATMRFTEQPWKNDPTRKSRMVTTLAFADAQPMAPGAPFAEAPEPGAAG